MASKTKEQKAAEAAARAEQAELERADRMRALESLIQSLRSDSENPELTDEERGEAAAALATAEAELAGLKGSTPEPKTKAQAHKVRTTLRFGCPIKGRSKCTLDGPDGPVTVWMEDGLPVESSGPVTDADLSRAGFR